MRLFGVAGATVAAIGIAFSVPTAHADNKRLNDGVVSNVYTVQRQAGCKNGMRRNGQLQVAAQRHTLDVLNNRDLNGDIGSDGSSAQSRANDAGYHGKVAETVAINPALAISGIELINQWYHDPASFNIMSDCANTEIAVWSESSNDRTAVVAVYGQPFPPINITGPPSADPFPDYDASDEFEFGINWLPWILRGAYPPPGYPPN